MFINMAFKRAYSKPFLPPALRSFLVLVHLWKNTPPLKIVKYSKSKIRLVPTLLSSKMKGKRAFHILAPRASFGSPVPPIGPIQPPTENQHPPYGAAYGWRYPPRLRLCFNSHDGHGSPALPGHGHHSFAFAFSDCLSAVDLFNIFSSWCFRFVTNVLRKPMNSLASISTVACVFEQPPISMVTRSSCSKQFSSCTCSL